MSFLVTFILLSIVNVVFSTIRSITTIKSNKFVASLISGGYFAFYNVMLVYTVADFPMWQKCLITFCCNVIGVFIVKLVEEKMQKDRLWKIETAIPNAYNPDDVKKRITLCGISCNYIEVGKWNIFNCYCTTQEQTKAVTEISKEYGGKISAYESAKL